MTVEKESCLVFNVGVTAYGTRNVGVITAGSFRYHASVLLLCVQEISNEYWCFPGLNPEGSDEMTKDSYLKLNRKLHLALVRCGCGRGCGRGCGCRR